MTQTYLGNIRGLRGEVWEEVERVRPGRLENSWVGGGNARMERGPRKKEDKFLFMLSHLRLLILWSNS